MTTSCWKAQTPANTDVVSDWVLYAVAAEAEFAEVGDLEGTLQKPVEVDWAEDRKGILEVQALAQEVG